MMSLANSHTMQQKKKTVRVCAYTYIHVREVGRREEEREGGKVEREIFNGISVSLKFFKVTTYGKKGKKASRIE